MWAWLFGSTPERLTVQLVPDASAKSLPGFQHGGLTLIANKGDTFQKLMDNFNTYRGPDSQIHKLYAQDGQEIPFSAVINAPVICIVKKI
jgi:hypothetical protein